MPKKPVKQTVVNFRQPPQAKTGRVLRVNLNIFKRLHSLQLVVGVVILVLYFSKLWAVAIPLLMKQTVKHITMPPINI